MYKNAVFKLLIYKVILFSHFVLVVYFYAEATGRSPGDVAYLVSPQLTDTHNEKCLTFLLNTYGVHYGNFSVLDDFKFELFTLERSKQYIYPCDVIL